MISPYLLRPLRSLEEVLAERMRRGAVVAEAPETTGRTDSVNGRRPEGRPELVLIDGSKR